MRWTDVPAEAWRTPQELVQEGFRHSRVVMLNEAHNGLTRCIRTRRVGRQVLPSAHAMGVRHLAMEALQPGDAETANASRRPPEAAGGYLAQPDMRDLIQTALALGWTLWRYEADIDRAPAALVAQGLMSQAFTNWREVEQARNLAGGARRPRRRGPVAGLVRQQPRQQAGPGRLDLDGLRIRRPGGGGGLRDRPGGDGGLSGP